MGATEERTVDRRTAARTEPGGAAAVRDQQTQAGPGGPGEQVPVSQKILRAIVIVNIYREQKCASQKILILWLRVFSNVT